MKNRDLRIWLLTLAVICIMGLVFVGPTVAATGTKTFKFSPKAIESRVDCLITYLRQERQIEVPEDFKTITGVEKLLRKMGAMEVSSNEEQRALNEAVRQLLKKLLAEFKGPSEYRQIIVSMLANLEMLPEGYCEPEAYEAEGPLRLYGRDLLDEREEYKDDPAPPPTPAPEAGNFIFYGKKYTLPSDLTSTNNGLLLLSDEDFVLDENSGEWSGYPPAIAPLWVLTWEDQTAEGRIPISNVFDSPTITETDSFYRYAYPQESFSATLYTNPKSEQSDWIVFSYGDVTLPEDTLSVFVGLMPGDGKEGHPGQGEPRSFAERSGWFGVDLSGETGESFTNDPGSYLTIGEGFMFFNPFDLRDSFLVFRPDGNDRYTVTAGTRKMVVDSVGLDRSKTTLDMAVENVRDEELLSRVDAGEFKPSSYTYGLQALTDGETRARLNTNGFLAYAVQVEEDRLNKEILEMYQDSVKDEIRRDNIRNALEAGDIRRRDDILTQEADAQAGRVTRDHEGNWVRAQQYILRPDNKTIKVLNVCLRGKDAGDLSGLSTMDFTTTLKTDYQGDLRALPWGKWLDTERGLEFFGDVVLTDIEPDPNHMRTPELQEMYVQFTNSEGESLRFDRAFGEEAHVVYKDSFIQPIKEETLSLSSKVIGDRSYTYSENGGAGTFGINDASPGIEYVLVDTAMASRNLDIKFFLSDDLGTRDKAIPANDDFREIWDALRVNESGAASIGENNLEISIDETASVFSRPINVVYIPMSRMVWRDHDAK